MGLKYQSAMEFLVTYSWAIVIVAVVISLLVAIFFVLPKPVAKFSCFIAPQFPCTDALVSLNSTNAILYFVIQNKVGQKINITNVFLNITSTYPSQKFSGKCYPSILYPSSYAICKIPFPKTYSSLSSFQIALNYTFV
ncbi:MAG: hypothetical protein ACP5FX_00940 [Candidatus Micrarchaeia archaeon]